MSSQENHTATPRSFKNRLRLASYATGIVLGGSVLLSGCSGESNVSVDLGLTPGKVAEQQIKVSDFVDLFMTETFADPSSNKTRLNSLDLVPVGAKSTMEVYNFTNWKFNKKAAEGISRDIFKIAQRRDVIPYRINGEELLLHTAPKDLLRTAVLFTPEKFALNESFLNTYPYLKKAQAFTDQNYQVGVLRIPNWYPGDYERFQELDATTSFAIEACNLLIEVKVTDLAGQEVADPYTQIFGQDVACNSLGASILIKNQGATYGRYRNFMNEHPFPLAPGFIDLASYPMIILPKDQYDVLSRNGNVVS